MKKYIKNLSKEVIGDIINDYVVNKHSSTQISKKNSISEQSVLRILKNNNTLIRSPREIATKHTLNHNFFEKIDTEEKAYWLGYMYADGCVHKSKYNYVISLTCKDLDHITKFKNSLESSHKIITSYSSKSNYKQDSHLYKIALYSEKMLNDLISKGCVEKKTFLLKFPTKDQVPKELVSHFIRGYFDGDGSISYGKKYKGFVDICGIYPFLNGIRNYLGLNKNMHIYKDKRKESECWSIKLSSKKNVDLFYNKIYKDSIISMNRKKEKFITIITKRLNDYNQPSLKKDEGIV